MTLLDDLRLTLDRWSVDHGRLVVAVSGGADSTALLHALAEAQTDLELICAHVNHELRGDESERDAITVENHARTLGIDCRIVRSMPNPELIRLRGVEAAARVGRYQALQTIRTETGATWIATGHTMDDQAETVLQKLITGAPVESLRAIMPVTPTNVIRPLLGTRRQPVHDWLHDRDIPHRFDSSNEDFRFLRNRIRHVLLPKLESRDAQVVSRLASIANHVGEIQNRLVPVRRNISKKWARTPDSSELAEIDLPVNRSLRRIVLLEEIRRLVPDGRQISSERLESLPEELRSSGRISLGEGLEAVLENDSIILALALEEPIEPFSRTIRCGESIELSEIGASVHIRRVVSMSRLTDENRLVQVFALPAGTSDPGFVIRNRRPGDRFQPLGMQREKRLKDLLIDRKIPLSDRDRLPLLVYDDMIVWVPGVEVSERFRVSPGRDLYEVRVDYGSSATRESS